MSIVLDAGSLVAIDRRDRTIGALLRLAQQQGTPVCTSGAVVAQVWRDGARQANLARTLRGVNVAALDDRTGRSIGALLARSRTSDVVDGHVALLVGPNDQLLTSDPDDLRRLLNVRKVSATLVRV